MISEIKFNPAKYSNYKFPSSSTSPQLQNLNKLNILIGPNNSGKSRFLRTLFIDSDYDFRLMKYDIVKLKEAIDDTENEIKKLLIRRNIKDADNIDHSLEELKKITYYKKGETDKIIGKFREFAKKLSTLHGFSKIDRYPGVISTGDPNDIITDIKVIGNNLLRIIDDIFPTDFNYEIHKVYVPILRGLRPIHWINPSQFLHDDSYKSRTIKDYFKDIDENKNKSLLA
jgi:hypothetical protein